MKQGEVKEIPLKSTKGEKAVKGTKQLYLEAFNKLADTLSESQLLYLLTLAEKLFGKDTQ
jgi:hypothetical protein